jgi:hypothetical protein
MPRKDPLRELNADSIIHDKNLEKWKKMQKPVLKAYV